MAYATSNPPVLMVDPRDGTTPKVWIYRSADAVGDVDAAGYFANGQNLGMKVDDIVFVIDTDTHVPTLCAVSAVSSGAATVVQMAIA